MTQYNRIDDLAADLIVAKRAPHSEQDRRKRRRAAANKEKHLAKRMRDTEVDLAVMDAIDNLNKPSKQLQAA
jgi:hypothetical protein